MNTPPPKQLRLPLPEGYPGGWHNPANVTPEQVGPEHRLLVPEELGRKFACEWFTETNAWAKTSLAINGYTIYRVPISKPLPHGEVWNGTAFVKPWTLSRHIPGFRPLREDEEWHRNDFKKEMLPEGRRPLLLREKRQLGDVQTTYSGTILNCIPDNQPLSESHDRTTTTRPLPESPAPQPLSAEDVPPGSVFRHPRHTGGFSSIVAMTHDGVWMLCMDGRINCLRWTTLRNENYEILRPGSTEWEPCSK